MTGLNMGGAVAKSIREFNNEVGLFLKNSSAERYLATAIRGLPPLKVNKDQSGEKRRRIYIIITNAD